MPRGPRWTELIPVSVRFWLKVWPIGDCWEWRAYRNRRGYGEFRLRPGHTILAHRYAFQLAKGPIPEGLELDHRCKNPRCVRPSHLEAVTHRENLLRSNSFSGVHARKTHCPRGHAYDRVNKDGQRVCLACRRIRRANAA